MGISIDPVAVLKELASRYERKEEAMLDYLDEIAAEAESLARVWEAVTQELATGGGADISDPWIRSELRKYSAPNSPHYERLMRFYKNISEVVGGRIGQEQHDSLAMYVGSLLYHRELTLESYRAAVERMSSPVFFESENSGVDIRDLAQSVAVLHKEAAALHVFARTARAKR